MTPLDKFAALEDQVLAFLRSRAMIRLIAAVVVVAGVVRRLRPDDARIANITEALVYAGAALGVVSPGLRRPEV